MALLFGGQLEVGHFPVLEGRGELVYKAQLGQSEVLGPSWKKGV